MSCIPKSLFRNKLNGFLKKECHHGKGREGEGRGVQMKGDKGQWKREESREREGQRAHYHSVFYSQHRAP